MEFCALSSGSSGNSFFVKQGKTAILIDAGISCKQILNRLDQINQSPEQIKAIFVTHEHIDHVRGIDVLSRKLNIPVYMPKKVAGSCYVCSSMDLVTPINNNESIMIDGLAIESFPKSHDAVNPLSYSIKSKEGTLSIITDIGYACKNVIDHVAAADSLILESNHDFKMLVDGRYPHYLKKRIASDVGHLSNYDAATLVLQHATKKLKNLMLAHMSINNNTPEAALDTFKLINERKDLKPKVHLSQREKPSDYIKMK